MKSYSHSMQICCLHLKQQQQLFREHSLAFEASIAYQFLSKKNCVFKNASMRSVKIVSYVLYLFYFSLLLLYLSKVVVDGEVV